MRILLDESLPQEIRNELPEHTLVTVGEAGWSGLRNGELLLQAADRFDVFVTADQNLQFQQNLSKLPIADLVLVAFSNRIDLLRPLIPGLRSALNALQPRMLVRIGDHK
jgi:hypothetical protein